MVHHYHPSIGTKPPPSTLTFDRKNDFKKPHHKQQMNNIEHTFFKGSTQDNDVGKIEQEKIAQL
jgi:hypothetical protein